MKVLFQSSIEKVETRKDRTVKIILGTSREMSSEDTAQLFSLSGYDAWTLLSANDDITESDIPEAKPDPLIKTKSQSQRLRNTLFVLWKQRGAEGRFEDFYETMTERIIEWVKDKLN